MFNWDSEARRYVEGNDLAMTTFGPLKDYVPKSIDDYALAVSATAGADAVMDGLARVANDNRLSLRQGDWMQTYTGRQFWPMDPCASEVHIEDIAHSLSMQCRFAGHCQRFYSVAEHSVHLARYVAPEHALWALLHDASEAYLVDVPRPVKPFLSGYKDAEKRVMQAICAAFRLPHAMPAEVHAADNRILADERSNMALCVAEWSGYDKPLGVSLEYWEPERAEDEFLAAYYALETMRS